MTSVYALMFLALSSFVGLSLGACPKDLVTVPIDPDFVIKNQPADGWFMPAHSQLTKEQLFGLTPVPAPKPAEGSKKLCVAVNVVVKGSPAPITVAYTCTYKETISEQVCAQKLPDAPAGAPSLPGTPAGVPSASATNFPQTFTLQYVKTDNKNYAAYGACVNNEKFIWGVIATSDAPLDDATKKEILAALHIEKEDEKQDDSLNYGQLGVTAGDCPAVPTAPKIKTPNPADVAKGGLPKVDAPKSEAGKGLSALPAAGGLGGGIGK